jgi:hypothetical protein
MLKIIFLHTICLNSDMFQFISIIFKLLNMNKAYKHMDGLLNN